MKKFFTVFFVTLGVIFFVLLLAIGYFLITDPFNLKPLLFGSSRVNTTKTENSEVKTDKHPGLSDTQEKTLETFGIDPSKLPSTLTPEQEACFTTALGAKRVAEIKAGDAPTATDIYKAKSCLQ